MQKKEALDILKMMLRIRFFEERAKKLYKQKMLSGNFLGALHTYIGQEAIAVGVCLNLRKNDYVFSTHRCHGHFIAKGGDVRRMMAELQGKQTGYCLGRGGSMHLFDTTIGFMGGNGIVGAGLPLAIGAAYSSFYRHTDQVTVCFFGDGAACQGTFHESLNIAALWKLPVIFVCENNCYAVTTSVAETISIPDIGERAQNYGMTGNVVDGNDVLSVLEASRKAIDRARNGAGPTLLECKTYRIDPHCMVISETRNKTELEEWKKKDPIPVFQQKILKEKLASEIEFKQLEKEVLKEIDEAEKFAMESPYPDPDDFLTEIKD
jgi:pyruvate dehydrogenase E1 component alpha subunit